MKSHFFTKSTVLIASSLLFALGCGSPQGMRVNGSASQSGPQGAENPTANQQIDPAVQSEAIAALKDAALYALSAKVESLDTSSFHQSNTASFAPRAISIDQTLACPGGGSISVVADATLEIAIAKGMGLSIAAEIESGQVVANNCQSARSVINADVELKPSALVGEASLANKAIVFSGEGVSGLKGGVDIKTSSGHDFQCDFDLDAEGMVDGTVSLGTNRSVDVAIKGSLEGEACGNAVDESIDETITF